MTATTRWFLENADLMDVTPVKARDLIVRCFFEAQKESFAAAGKAMGKTEGEVELRTIVAGAVRAAFRESGGDFDHPTKSSLMAAVEVLARKAQRWGTPPEIVQHHRGQIEKILMVVN